MRTQNNTAVEIDSDRIENGSVSLERDKDSAQTIRGFYEERNSNVRIQRGELVENR
jgi:hypothetical protein